MLPRSKRLTTAIFDEVFTTGRTAHSALFTLRMKKTDGPSRFAISVSKKIAKSAVVRNKIRRRTYSALRAILENPKSFKCNVHVVLIAKNGSDKALVGEIANDIRSVFVKSGILE